MRERTAICVGDEIITTDGMRGEVIKFDGVERNVAHCHNIPFYVYDYALRWKREDGKIFKINDEYPEYLTNYHRIGKQILHPFSHIDERHFKFVVETLEEESRGGYDFRTSTPIRWHGEWLTIKDFKSWVDNECKDFSQLENGCIFTIYTDKVYFMKIEQIDANGKTINAIRLKDGTPQYFKETDRVWPSEKYCREFRV